MRVLEIVNCFVSIIVLLNISVQDQYTQVMDRRQTNAYGLWIYTAKFYSTALHRACCEV